MKYLMVLHVCIRTLTRHFRREKPTMKKEVISLSVMACIGVSTFAEPVCYKSLGLCVGPYGNRYKIGGIRAPGNAVGGAYAFGYGWGELYGIHGLAHASGGFNKYSYGSSGHFGGYFA